MNERRSLNDEILDVLLETTLISSYKLQLLFPHLIIKFNSKTSSNNEWYQRLLKMLHFKIQVKYNPTILRNINNLSEELCLEAIKQNPHAIDHIPREMITVEMCEIAVSQIPRLISRVPLITEKICKIAISVGGGKILRLIPNGMRSYEVCFAAVTHKKCTAAMQHVPDAMKSPQLCIAAVTLCGCALRHVPNELITEEMCIVAVTQRTVLQFSLYMQFIPREMRTEKVCLASISNNGLSLRYVPQKLRTKEMCLLAVSRAEGALQHVPEEFQEVCLRRIMNK